MTVMHLLRRLRLARPRGAVRRRPAPAWRRSWSARGRARDALPKFNVRALRWPRLRAGNLKRVKRAVAERRPPVFGRQPSPSPSPSRPPPPSPSPSPRRQPWRALKLAGVTVTLLTLAAVAGLPSDISALSTERSVSWGIDRAALAAALTPAIEANHYPPSVALPTAELPGALTVKYTIDAALQSEAQRLLKKYKPDYGVFVALEPDTGRVLAMASSARAGNEAAALDNMTMVNSYPAASISKIITAVAAMDAGKTAPASIIPFNGKTTSLYKNHVFKHRDNRWTRKFSFEESFAKSVNSVFGRVGAVHVGGDEMLNTAQRLGFNGEFAADFAFANGEVQLDTADAWQVAEMASGYTRRNTLSPLHGAALAAAAVNGGRLIAPGVVQAVLGPNGVPLYWHEATVQGLAMRAETAEELKRLMRATVIRGSARKSFRGFHRGEFKDALVGGKTGSLRGLRPKGEYDWFVGFGELGPHKIAFAALCINKERWYVKSTRLARELLEFYFRARLDADTVTS